MPRCGDDHVTAINLTRVLTTPPDAAHVERARAAAVGKYGGASAVEIVHYIGGPCNPEEISRCVVTGGTHGCGWTVVTELADAITLAHQRSYARYVGQGDVRGGQCVRLTGLQSRPELNGECGIAMKFAEETGRWLW